MERGIFRKSYILFAFCLFGCSLRTAPIDVRTIDAEIARPDNNETGDHADARGVPGRIFSDGRFHQMATQDSAPDQQAESRTGRSAQQAPGSLDTAEDVTLPVPVYLDIPAEAHIERCKKYYLKKYRRDYLSGLDRRRPYGEMIQRKVRQRGLPEALAWMPMVETWFETDAYSRSHAAGLWQLIPATAKTFGLRIDDWVDERFDPEKSTDAALDVLEYLHERTGDWLLAIAAYNAGEGRVNRAIKEVGSRDYWMLAKHRALPSQTRFYVSAVLALAEIDRDPEAYGIEIPMCGDMCKGQLLVNRQISLREIATQCDLDIEELHKMNPSLKRAWTPPDAYPFTLHLPKDRCEAVDNYLAGSRADENRHLVVHLIQPGDTLSGLANHYQSTVDAIMSVNRMTRHLIIAGTEILIPAGLTWK